MAAFPAMEKLYAVAVSGGADSMALLLLADAWAKQNHQTVAALTVDHGLRAEAAAEAAQVAGWCRARGIAHHLLRPSDMGMEVEPTQESARRARYALLTGWCQKHGACLLTAHHRGDQAETLFFRVARGSGIVGLSCIAPASEMDGVRLLRPLLGFGKNQLVAFLRAQGQPWIEDPSNQSPKYTRNVIRQQLQSLPDAEALEIRAAELAAKFAQFRAIIERQLAMAEAQTVVRHAGEVRLKTDILENLPQEMALMLLSRLVQSLSGSQYPPRSGKTAHLYSRLKSRQAAPAQLAGLDFVYHLEGRYHAIRKNPRAS